MILGPFTHITMPYLIPSSDRRLSLNQIISKPLIKIDRANKKKNPAILFCEFVRLLLPNRECSEGLGASKESWPIWPNVLDGGSLMELRTQTYLDLTAGRSNTPVLRHEGVSCGMLTGDRSKCGHL